MTDATQTSADEKLEDKLRMAADEVILADKEGRDPVLPDGIICFSCTRKDIDEDLH